MAEDNKAARTIRLGFVSNALTDDDVQLQGVDGREAISQLYQYDLLLVRPSGPFTQTQLDDLLRERCVIALGDRPGDIVHGLLSHIELLDAQRDGVARYRARLVPQLSLLDLGAGSAVFQDVTVVDLVEKILGAYGLRKDEQFAIRVGKKDEGPKHEYVVQYQETDWAFIQRWLEHEGLFYWFEQTKTGEKLIIADQNADTTPIEDPALLQYADRNVLGAGKPTIWDWRIAQKRVPAGVTLLEYNYRSPGSVLVESAPVDPAGFGTAVGYGQHFKTSDQGKRLAKLRAERLQVTRRTFRARTDCSRFRVGHTFEVEHLLDSSADGSFLITSLRHRVGYPVSGDGEEPAPYVAEFAAISEDVPFRPEVRTPWPRIYGIMHAGVDADGAGALAQLDDQGRYKVKLPFDGFGKTGLGCSRWIRRAQPYSGAGYGMHLPLHKGAEVLLAFLDGDPDRPVIVGAVPNPATKSPVTSANASQGVIQTASSVRLEIEDQQA